MHSRNSSNNSRSEVESNKEEEHSSFKIRNLSKKKLVSTITSNLNSNSNNINNNANTNTNNSGNRPPIYNAISL